MKYLVQEIYAVEADTLEDAEDQAKSNAKSDSVIHVAETLGGMFNPYHLQTAQDAFGHMTSASE